MKKLLFGALALCAVLVSFTSCGEETPQYDGIEVNFATGEYYGDMLGTGADNFAIRFESKDYAANSEAVTAGAYFTLDLSSEPRKKLEPKEGTYEVVQNIKYLPGTITYCKDESYIEDGMGSYGYIATNTNYPQYATGGYLFNSGTVTFTKQGSEWTVEAEISYNANKVKFRYVGPMMFTDRSQSSAPMVKSIVPPYTGMQSVLTLRPKK